MESFHTSRVERHKRPTHSFTPYGRRPRDRTRDTRRHGSWNEKSSTSMSSSLASEEEERVGTIKVSERSNVKEVASRIAHLMRRGEDPVLMSLGAKSCNQAVKAIAIARKCLIEDDIGIALRPDIRDGRKLAYENAHNVVIGVDVLCACSLKDVGYVELAVSSKSIPSTIAGALAARVREGVVACLTGIGVDAIAKSIMAISTTRSYLEEDMMDIKACPEFIHVEKDGETLSAIRFNILVEDV